MLSISRKNPGRTFKTAAVQIGEMAYRALLEEVHTTPKPGLVDLYSPGAHKDMDVFTFERSAAALKPYFTAMAMEGLCFPGAPELLFESIRRTGLWAEGAMYRATAGVNTHKGLIFHLGILGAAAGACVRTGGGVSLNGLLKKEQAMVGGTLAREVEDMRKPAGSGEKRLIRTGPLGARGEAMSGYASVLEIALPVMDRGLKEGRDWNLVKLETLFALMSRVEDSNILKRHDPRVLSEVRGLAKDFLREGGAYRDGSLFLLKCMDREFIRRNISAGGCADLLAVTIFITLLVYGPVRRSVPWNS
ncbi:triphosphoribosyl-dephospho-CoA synthase [Lachnospiraceae bacterium 54-53]